MMLKKQRMFSVLMLAVMELLRKNTEECGAGGGGLENTKFLEMS